MNLEVDFGGGEVEAAPKTKGVNGHAPAPSLLPESDPELQLISLALAEARAVMPKAIGIRMGGRDAKIAWTACCRVYERDGNVDVGTLKEELVRTGDYERLGGWHRLNEWTKIVPTTLGLDGVIGTLRRLEARRELERLVGHAGRAAKGDDPEGFLEELGLAEAKGAATNARPLFAFNLVPDTDQSVLLGNRYLSRGDGAILSSTSGMGKSALSLQMATEWALGAASVGIKPNGPLRSLIVQAEDSDGDVAEVAASLSHVLKLSDEQRALLNDRVRVVTDRSNRGPAFITELRRHIAAHKPDLVWINPLQAFLKGDITSGEDLGAFLREQLSALHGPVPSFAYMIVHHTTKPPTGPNRAERQWHEAMYDMAGGAELINWARAILSLRATPTEGQFNLFLAKRGRRANVLAPSASGAQREVVTTIPLKHSSERFDFEGRSLPVIYWEGRKADAVPVATEPRKKAKSGLHFSQLVPHIPNHTDRPIAHQALERYAKAMGGCRGDEFVALMEEAVAAGAVERVADPALGMCYRKAI